MRVTLNALNLVIVSKVDIIGDLRALENGHGVFNVFERVAKFIALSLKLLDLCRIPVNEQLNPACQIIFHGC